MERNPFSITALPFFLATVALFCAGCSLLEPEMPPGPSVPESYRLKGPQAISVLSETDDWWRRFNDPVLDRLMEEAFSGNLDLQQALFRLEEAEAKVKKANATLWPRLDLSFERGRVGHGNITDNAYQYSLAASYEVDVFQRLRAYRRQRELERLATRQDVKSVLLTLSAQIANTYFKILESRERIGLQQFIIGELERTLELVRLRYSRGLVSSLDVYQADQNLQANRAALPLLQQELETNKNALAVLLGLPPSELFPPGGGDKLFGKEMGRRLPEMEFRFDPGTPADIISLRPDVREAYLRLEAQNREVAQALAELLPRFDITAAYGGENFESRNLFDYENVFWNIFAQVSQPLFRGGELRAEVEVQRSKLHQAAAAYQAAVLRALREVEDALAAQDASRRNLDYLKDRLESLKSSTKISVFRYRYGLSDFLPVLQAQTAYQSVAQEIVKMKYMVISNQIGLVRAVGGRWMDRTVDGLIR